jgi:predicted porin
MGDRSRRARLCAGVSVFVIASMFGATGVANAQSISPDELRALKAQIDALQAKVKDLESKQQQSDANATAAKRQASEAQAQAAAAKASASQASATAAKTQTQVANLPVKGTEKDEWFFRHKPGDPLTFETPGGEITGYGNIDVSFDGASKSVTGWTTSPANMPEPGPPVGIVNPTGNFGWMPDISTNLSYLGVRGFQKLPGTDWRFVYQLEAGFDVSAFPSTRQTNSNISNQVNGALFSRNSYIGLANPAIGAIKIGKTDAPYKTSTAAFNPFSGMWGDYQVIMGNTGGDNRVEFGTRIAHAIWYESPNMGGWQFNVLYAPGQNRSWISDNIPSGEADCAGGNDPTSGANEPPKCIDGSYSDVVSANISYTSGGFYATAAYEWHHAVNRQNDITAMFGINSPTAPTSPNCALLADGVTFADTFQSTICNQDVADEDAAKIGALYRFESTGTTVGAIVEHMNRYVPSDLAFQNERTRWGTWVFLSQQLTPVDSVHLGWAHAFHTPGDPGQHNDATLGIDGTGNFAPNNNQADMVTAAYKHMFSKNLIWYSDIAATFNGPSAHYDLGAGGRGVTTDCHDIGTSSATGGTLSSGHCFTGTTIVGVSTGVQWRF